MDVQASMIYYYVSHILLVCEKARSKGRLCRCKGNFVMIAVLEVIVIRVCSAGCNRVVQGACAGAYCCWRWVGLRPTPASAG